MPESNRVIRDWDLTCTNLHRVRQQHYEVAVIPVGSIEAHNRHLPEGQDCMHTTYIAQKSCALSWKECQSVVCLPCLPYGVDCNMMAYPLAIHVSQNTLDAILREIVVSLRKHGIRKVLIINGHGGNEFRPFVRQIQCDLDVYVFCCNWWQVGRDCFEEIFTNSDDHAGQMETSVAMALYPELIEPNVAGDGKTRPFRFEALQKGWVSTSRDFALLNDHCAVGDPSGASAEKGREYVNIVVKRIGSFLTELTRSPIDDYFPYTRDIE